MSLRRQISKLGTLFRRRKPADDLAEEIRSHLEMEERENLERGMPPDEAHYAALRRFGNVASVQDTCREMWGWTFVESVWQDVRFGLRQLGRSPGFTVVAVLTLALGIGANTAVFSLINAALLKMLPVRNPQELVQFFEIHPLIKNGSFSYPAFQLFQEKTQDFSSIIAFANLENLDVDLNGHGQIANGEVVSGNYFSTLGVSAMLGRTIDPVDDQAAGGNAVAVVSYKYWRERLAGDPKVVGTKILLNSYPFTVIGVTPPEFFGLAPGYPIDVFVPLKMIAPLRPGYAMTDTRYNVLTSPLRRAFVIMGRLRPGSTLTMAQARMEPTFRKAINDMAAGLAGTPLDSPQSREMLRHDKVQLAPAGQGLDDLRERFSKPLWILMAAVGLLLLIACANVATLLLVKAQSRRHEMAARLVLGARRLRLAQQLITESVLLALAGGLVGIALAFWACGSLMTLMGHTESPILLAVRPDLRVLGFTLLISVVTAILFGLIPAWQLLLSDMPSGLVPYFHGAGRTTGRSHSTEALIALQVAASLVLIVGAGLLVRSLENLKNFYPGFRTESVLLFPVNPRMLGYTVAQTNALYQRLTDRIDAIPGIRGTSFSMDAPLSGTPPMDTPTIEGYGITANPVYLAVVGPHYFTVLETPVLEGRDFKTEDSVGAPKVAIINKRMAQEFYGDTSPIGRRISTPGWVGDKSWYSIIGVVADTKDQNLRAPVPPMFCIPLEQTEVPAGVTFEIRTASDAAAAAPTVLRVIAQVDGRLPLSGMRTLNDQMDDSLLQERLIASLASLFGLLAVLLACVGLYGLLAYKVSRKTNEIGIRMALGAGRVQIAGMILRQASLMVLAGLVVGIPAAMGVARLISSQLYGLVPYDPMTILFAVSLMTAVASLASYLPARRAMRVDPMAALRQE
ncbi:MAG: ADOP family duplicated permease [Terriglobia bacterium]